MRANKLIERVPQLEFNLEQIKKEFTEISQRQDVMSSFKKVGQFCFTNTKEGLERGLGVAEGAVHEFDPSKGYKVTDESLFTELNPVFEETIFAKIYRKTAEVLKRPLGRMRVMRLLPGECYIMHNDYNRRYQLAIETNRFSYMIFRNSKPLLVPEDGHVYFFEGRVRHTAINAGNAPRYHLVISTWGKHW